MRAVTRGDVTGAVDLTAADVGTGGANGAVTGDGAALVTPGRRFVSGRMLAGASVDRAGRGAAVESDSIRTPLSPP